MNGNVPLLLHASVPPLRQAPCHGYSINHSIKQLKIYCFTFLPVPNFLPYIHTHTRWQNDLSELIVYLHLMKREREKGTMQGAGMVMVKFFFFYSSSCCNIGHSFIHATALKRRTLHACTWKSNSSPGERERDHWGLCQSFCRFGEERDKKKRTVKRHICEYVCWGMSVGLHVCIPSS